MKRFVGLCVAGTMLLAAGGCAGPDDVARAGPGTPGWTGRRMVPGDSSTIAGDAEATYLQQKWPLGGVR